MAVCLDLAKSMSCRQFFLWWLSQRIAETTFEKFRPRNSGRDYTTQLSEHFDADDSLRLAAGGSWNRDTILSKVFERADELEALHGAQEGWDSACKDFRARLKDSLVPSEWSCPKSGKLDDERIREPEGCTCVQRAMEDIRQAASIAHDFLRPTVERLGRRIDDLPEVRVVLVVQSERGRHVLGETRMEEAEVTIYGLSHGWTDLNGQYAMVHTRAWIWPLDLVHELVCHAYRSAWIREPEERRRVVKGLVDRCRDDDQNFHDGWMQKLLELYLSPPSWRAQDASWEKRADKFKGYVDAIKNYRGKGDAIALTRDHLNSGGDVSMRLRRAFDQVLGQGVEAAIDLLRDLCVQVYLLADGEELNGATLHRAAFKMLDQFGTLYDEYRDVFQSSMQEALVSGYDGKRYLGARIFLKRVAEALKLVNY